MAIKYRTKIPVPEEMRSIMQEIQGVAGVVGINETAITIEFEVDEEFTTYEMGYAVSQLEDTLQAYYHHGESVSIPKPHEVEE